ncbi:MAG: 4Fe-4S binding protein, partial [Candidatus Avispirillum sp.]
MQEVIKSFAEQNHIDTMRVVDITSLTLEENRGYSYAILLIKALPKEYVDKLNRETETDYTVFANYERTTDELADKLAAVIQKEGYKAISQSEHGISVRGEYNEKTKSSILPHKKIAIMSGVGWIGKNNLLVTEKYGAALSMCSVLTDMPLYAEKTETILSDRCGDCNLCVKICPVQAIHGRKWELGISRDDIVDVYRCVTCLKCLA